MKSLGITKHKLKTIDNENGLIMHGLKKSDEVFKDSARLFYGTGYKKDVDVPSVISSDKSTELDDGIYSDAKNKIIFEVKDKVVVSSQNY